MKYLTAWWHLIALGHAQDDLMNDGIAGPRTECSCGLTWYW